MRYISSCILFLSFNCLAGNNVEPLGVNEGYVILPLVIEGVVPKSISLEDSELFGESYKVKRLKAGDNFELIILPAGEYKWTKISQSNNYYFNLEELEFSLIVKKGIINYGGHLIIDINPRFATANYSYVNRSSQIIKELEDCCKTLMSKYPLTFTGNSEDPFIEFYKSAITVGSH